MSLGFDYLDSPLEEDKEKSVFRCKREIFTDPRLFDLEMKHIFEGNWLYLAHESQIPEKNDYYTTQMGRQPIFIARNKSGTTCRAAPSTGSTASTKARRRSTCIRQMIDVYHL
jgi:benzoate/toluate 1,2-dioxygenase alpha subunit